MARLLVEKGADLFSEMHGEKSALHHLFDKNNMVTIAAVAEAMAVMDERCTCFVLSAFLPVSLPFCVSFLISDDLISNPFTDTSVSPQPLLMWTQLLN